jgi:hypothetical protein
MAGVPDTFIQISTKSLLCGGIGAKGLPSFQLSEEASWWSQIPKYFGTAINYFTVITFAKSGMLC